MPSRLNRKYPVIKDKYDLPGLRLNRFTEALPPTSDLSQWLGPVKDQGDLGACTAFSWSSNREFLYRKYSKWEKDTSVPKDQLILSPLFLYYMERQYEGDVSQDGGAQSNTGAIVLTQTGVCLETDDPYITADFKNAPTQNDMNNAQEYKVGAYHTIPDVQTLKSVLVSGYTASIGISVFDSFESDEAASTGNIPIPQSSEQCLGGHEITPFGYDDNHVNTDGSKGAIHILNSWGDEWGAVVGAAKGTKKGSLWLPYNYWKEGPDNTGPMVMDMLMCHLGRPWVATKAPVPLEIA